MDNNDITSTDNLNNKQFKRGRGRPRKNQIINYGDSGKNKQKVKIISSNDEEPIILQLPISLKEFHTLKNNTIFEKESKTNDETPTSNICFLDNNLLSII